MSKEKIIKEVLNGDNAQIKLTTIPEVVNFNHSEEDLSKAITTIGEPFSGKYLEEAVRSFTTKVTEKYKTETTENSFDIRNSEMVQEVMESFSKIELAILFSSILDDIMYNAGH